MTISGDISNAREYARKWAADHPITRFIAGRQSLLSDVTARGLGESFSATEAVGSLVVTADDLSRRLEIYSAQLPDQARWQAELFAMDMAREYQLEEAARTVGQAVDALDRIMPAVERSLAVVEQAPSLIAAEREATIKTLSAELTRAITFIQEERLAILKQLAAERIAVGQDVGEALVQQRQLLAQDIDGIASKAVDRAFLRAAQLGAASLVAAFLGIVGLMVIAKRMFVGSRGSGDQRAPEKLTAR